VIEIGEVVEDGEQAQLQTLFADGKVVGRPSRARTSP
jgi:hypothetical protein